MPASQKTLRSCTNLGLKTGTLRCAVLATIDHSLFIINFKTSTLRSASLIWPSLRDWPLLSKRTFTGLQTPPLLKKEQSWAKKRQFEDISANGICTNCRLNVARQRMIGNFNSMVKSVYFIRWNGTETAPATNACSCVRAGGWTSWG